MDLFFRLLVRAALWVRKPPSRQHLYALLAVAALAAAGKHPLAAVVVEQAEGNLLEVVSARRPPSGFSSALHGRQEQANEHADDGDHNQQFDERKAGLDGPSLLDERHTKLLKEVSGAKNKKCERTPEGICEKPHK